MMSKQSEPNYTPADYGSRRGNRFYNLPQGLQEAVHYAAELQIKSARAAGGEVPPIEVIRQKLAKEGDMDWMFEAYKSAWEAGDPTALSVQKKFALPQRGR